MNFTPPQEVRNNAKRGLELRSQYNRGGTAVGVARARDLSNGGGVSLDTIKRMSSYFARHEVDKKGEGWGKDSAGYIAWLLWGGDAGWSWAKGVIKDNEKKDKSGMAELARGYAAIVKADKNDDGTMTVYGKATDSSIDIDQQICDEAWLKQAMPEWMVSGGNIREQHSSIAAGVATEYEATPDGHYITALVVDPVSVKKVELGVLKGFSIGIRGPRVIRDTKAAGGRIVDGQIVEISLVDRPANPNAKLMLAKASEAGELEVVKQITIPSPRAVADLVKGSEDQARDSGGRFASADGGDSGTESTAGSASSSPHHEEARNIISNLEGQAASTTLDPDVQREVDAFISGAQDRLAESEKYHAEGNTRAAAMTMNFVRDRVLSAERLITGQNEMVSNGLMGQVIYGNDQAGTTGSPNAEALSRIASDYSGKTGKSGDADLVKFDPDQERDEGGRFGSGGGGGESNRNSGDVRNAEVSVQRLLDGKAGNSLNDTQDLAGRLGSEEDVQFHAQAEAFVSTGEDRLIEARESFSEGRNDEAFTALERASTAYENAGAYFDKGSDERMTDMANNMFAIASEINQVLANNKSATSNSKVEPMNTINKSELDEPIIDEPEIVPIVEVIEEDKEPANSLAEVKTLVGSLVKFDQKKYDQACAALAGLIVVEANEMKAGSEEVRSIELLLASIKALHEWYEGEVAEGEVPGGSLQPENEIEEMYMAANKETATSDEVCADCKMDKAECKCADKAAGMCADCELEKAECKCADKAAELDVDDAVVSAIIDKAVASAKASVVEEIDLLKSALEVERVKAIQLEGELETAKKAVAPTGPKRSGNATAIDTNALLLKAAEYTQKAKVTTDPTLAKGYRELAKDLIITSKQGE